MNGTAKNNRSQSSSPLHSVAQTIDYVDENVTSLTWEKMENYKRCEQIRARQRSRLLSLWNVICIVGSSDVVDRAHCLLYQEGRV